MDQKWEFDEELYKRDKAEFYRQKNQPFWDEMYANLETLKSNKSKLFEQWMEMKLRSKDMTMEEKILMRKTGREHDRVGRELIAACDRASLTLLLQPEEEQDALLENMNKFYDGELDKYAAFKIKYAEYMD
jgi:hypothetical protein